MPIGPLKCDGAYPFEDETGWTRIARLEEDAARATLSAFREMWSVVAWNDNFPIPKKAICRAGRR